MSYPPKIDVDMAFMPMTTPMFTDLILTLENDRNLKATRRRDMISGLRRVAKAIGRTPQDVPCNSRWLQPRLAKIAPAALGLSKKAWQNAVSDARSAMIHVGIVERRHNRCSDLSPAWQALWISLLASPHNKTLQASLCRFVHFVNNRTVAPDEVRREHADLYRDAMIHNEISKCPDVAYRAAINGWNLAARKLAGWPTTLLPLERRQKIISFQANEFPKPFLSDLEKLMFQFSHPDPFGENSRAKPLRPATIEQYRRQIVRFASDVVHSGVPIEEINCIAALLDPELVERGLRQMLLRTENRATIMVSEAAALLRNLSKITGQSEEIQKQLAKFARQVAAAPQRGMTRKNRDRLRVLQNEKNMHQLLHLPQRVFTHPPQGKANDYTKALAREDAVAIAILLVCPIRIKNLAGIHLEHHIQRPGDGRAYLVLTEDDLKNERSLEFELPTEVIRMIDRHMVTRCPQMCPPGTPWLFPRRDGQAAMLPSQLASRIAKRVRNETGLEVNAHLFRHIAVMNWLDANPGGYEVARRLLGHSEVSHTINFYSGLEVKSATRAFADLIETKKGRRK